MAIFLNEAVFLCDMSRDTPKMLQRRKAVQTPLAQAQAQKKKLLAGNLFDTSCIVQKTDDFLYFPLIEEVDLAQVELSLLEGCTLIEKDFAKREEKTLIPLKEALLKVLPAEVVERIKTAYDHIGDIAILEIDQDITQYDAIIGETLLSTNTKVATVLAKDSGHEGVFRTQKMRLLAGEDKRVALHRENGVVLEVHVEDVYFSLRLSTERKRIMGLVSPGEDVLVCFSGAGPYTCVLGKNTLAAHVTGIEINPSGHALAEKNIKRNKLDKPVGRVTTYCGDVNEFLPRLLTERKTRNASFSGYDRILMPLPKSAETFLEPILAASHRGTIIHFYAFLHEDKLAEAYTWIADACAKVGLSYSLLETVKCGQQAPHVYRYCIDFRIN